jgi:hypothetical protein
MPQLISIAAQTSSKFDTLIASPFDFGNIQEAFIFYHYGINEIGQEPAEKSIHSYLKTAKNAIVAEEPIIQNLLETYNLLEDFYSNSSGSIENISDVTIFQGSSGSLQSINQTLLNFQDVFDRGRKYVYASFNVINSSYTLELLDNRKIIIANSNNDINIFVPSNLETEFPIGTNLEIINIGTGKCFVKENNNVVIRNNPTTDVVSPDLNWNQVNSNFGNITIFSVDYGNGLWIIGGAVGQMRTSTDGSSWTTVNSNFGNTGIVSIAYGNGLWVAGGGYSTIRTSTNGSAWTTVTSNFNSTIRSIAYGNGLWIAGGYYGVMRTSTNGSAWTTVDSSFSFDFTSDIRSIAYGNGVWVAGGFAGKMSTSTNGSTWTTVNSNFGNTNIRSIAYGNGLWIAGGEQGQMRTSTNGSTWTTVSENFGNASITALAYGNGFWVAGIGGRRSSTDGITWTTNAGSVVLPVQGIAYGDDIWVSPEGNLGGLAIAQTSFDKIYKDRDQCLIYKRDENDWVIVS